MAMLAALFVAVSITRPLIYYLFRGVALRCVAWRGVAWRGVAFNILLLRLLQSAYLYNVQYVNDWFTAKIAGTYHSFELPFVFGNAVSIAVDF